MAAADSANRRRFAFVHALESAPLPGALRDVGYAVENPTYEAYTFSGSGRSAATDLAIYESAADPRPTVNIEFKSGGFSDGRQSIDAVAKDVAKLLAERVACGVWFHLVKNTDAMTLPRVTGLLQKAFDSLCEAGGLKRWMLDESVTLAPKSLIIHLCVIEKRYSLQRQLALGDGGLSAPIALPRFPAGGACPARRQCRAGRFTRSRRRDARWGQQRRAGVTTLDRLGANFEVAEFRRTATKS